MTFKACLHLEVHRKQHDLHKLIFYWKFLIRNSLYASRSRHFCFFFAYVASQNIIQFQKVFVFDVTWKMKARKEKNLATFWMPHDNLDFFFIYGFWFLVFSVKTLCKSASRKRKITFKAYVKSCQGQSAIHNKLALFSHIFFVLFFFFVLSTFCKMKVSMLINYFSTSHWLMT